MPPFAQAQLMQVLFEFPLGSLRSNPAGSCSHSQVVFVYSLPGQQPPSASPPFGKAGAEFTCLCYSMCLKYRALLLHGSSLLGRRPGTFNLLPQCSSGHPLTQAFLLCGVSPLFPGFPLFSRDLCSDLPHYSFNSERKVIVVKALPTTSQLTELMG